MTVGPTPWWLTVLQYFTVLTPPVAWIVLCVVLVLAWRDFRRLVDYYVLEEVEFIEEEIVTSPKSAPSKKAARAKKEGE